jgi:DNA polymerase III subunit delta
MAQKKAHEVDAFLKNPGKGWVLTLVYGPDRGMVSERAAVIAKASGVDLSDPFSVITLTADAIEEDPGRLLDEANTVSMFGGDRLIWIKDGGNGRKFVEAVKALCQSPPHACTVLIEADDLKKTAALRTTVEGADKAMALPCYADDARALDRLIDEELARESKTISLDARALLKQSLGGDRMSSRQELQKLMLYCRDEKTIEKAHVSEAVAEASASSVDDAIDAMIGGQTAKFEREYRRLIADGTAPYQFIRTAMRSLYTLSSLRRAMDEEGKSATAAVASARPPLFFARKSLFETAVSKLRQTAIIEALDRLQAANLESRKMSSLAPVIVHRVLMGIALERARAR